MKDQSGFSVSSRVLELGTFKKAPLKNWAFRARPGRRARPTESIVMVTQNKGVFGVQRLPDKKILASDLSNFQAAKDAIARLGYKSFQWLKKIHSI